MNLMVKQHKQVAKQHILVELPKQHKQVAIVEDLHQLKI